MSIYIVIPAYNEQKRILKTLENYRETLIENFSDDVSILVMSDSTDNTNNIVSKYASKHKQVKLVIGETRRGKGGALRGGFELACKDPDATIIGFVDADPSIAGKGILKLLNTLNNTKDIDGVIASRHVKGSEWIGKPKLSRWLASRGYNLFIRMLFGFNYRDTQCGAKFFRAKALRSVMGSLGLTDMSFDLNLLYDMKRLNYNVVEVPITYRWIDEGSKVKLKKQIPQMFIVAIGYRISHSPFNVLIPRKLKGFVYNSIRKW